MALSDLAVFNEWTYSTATEIIRQQVEKFNQQSLGTISLATVENTGDFSEEAYWKKLSGLVRRRNAYGSGAVAAINLQHITETMVKIAAGTPPVNMPPSQFNWIQRSPEEAGIVIGRQLAPDMMADMLNTGITAAVAALGQVATVVNDESGGAGGMGLMSLAKGAALFGDQSQAVRAWVMHSAKMHEMHQSAITNGTSLFRFETINVMTDGFGRVYIVSDSPSMVEANGGGAGIDAYHTLGLTESGIVVEQNNDYFANIDTDNGDENIQRTFQAEWSYNLGIKGFTWDKTNGGKSPTNAALGTATNWDRIATSDKDLAGVLVSTR